jgi:TusA-related sulfurtransferase
VKALSRFDKYDPYDGGFRAKLNAAISSANAGKIYAVSINTSGRVVIGGTGLVDIRGLICATEAMAAGDAIDVMTDGEIADVTTTGGAAFTAGALVYCHTDGTVDAVSTAGKAVAFTVEADRLIVRVPTTQAA